MGAVAAPGGGSGGHVLSGHVRIGISGWRYAPWRGVFYPRGLAQRRELEYAARAFPTIELNGSFYSLQRPEAYARWHDETPEGFVFAVKGSRFITHMKRLLDIGPPLGNFFASGLFRLRGKLGPFLWQFPERFAFDAGRFDAFFRLLPRDTDQMARLARRRDARLRGRAVLKPQAHLALRHAIEVRHPSFAVPEFVDLLRRHGLALVVADTAGKWPYLEDQPTDFSYLRLHGDKKLYVSGYGEPALQRWAERIRTWSAGGEPADARRVAGPAPRLPARDVYCYFDNDAKVKAPRDARRLNRILGLGPLAAPAPP